MSVDSDDPDGRVASLPGTLTSGQVPIGTLEVYLKYAVLLVALMDGYDKALPRKADGSVSYPRARWNLPPELAWWFLNVIRRFACGVAGADRLDYCPVWKRNQSTAPIPRSDTTCQRCPKPAVPIAKLMEMAFPNNASRTEDVFRTWLRGDRQVSMDTFVDALGNLAQAGYLPGHVTTDLAILLLATDALHAGLKNRREQLMHHESLWAQLADSPMAICLTWPELDGMDPEMAYLPHERAMHLGEIDLIPSLPPKSQYYLAATKPMLRHWLGRQTVQAVIVTPYPLPCDTDHHPDRHNAPLALRLIIKPIPAGKHLSS